MKSTKKTALPSLQLDARYLYWYLAGSAIPAPELPHITHYATLKLALSTKSHGHLEPGSLGILSLKS